MNDAFGVELENHASEEFLHHARCEREFVHYKREKLVVLTDFHADRQGRWQMGSLITRHTHRSSDCPLVPWSCSPVVHPLQV
jgi:hypothetical protein